MTYKKALGLLIGIAKDNGIKVCFHESESEIRGYCIPSEKKIVLNKKAILDKHGERMFYSNVTAVLAHEIGHIMLQHIRLCVDSFDEIIEQEKEAWMYASFLFSRLGIRITKTFINSMEEGIESYRIAYMQNMAKAYNKSKGEK